MTEAEAKEKLVAEARKLGVAGVLENMKPETLEKKIADAKAKNASANVQQNTGLKKFGKFQNRKEN